MMNSHFLSLTTPSWLEVETGYYQYIAKGNILHNLKGFITDNVCDCVCGYISSDQGFSFFHFHRRNDPEDLKQRIEKDFENSTSVKITLFGGNFVNSFFPWKEAKRNLHFLSKEEKLNYHGIAAMRLIQESNPLKKIYQMDVAEFFNQITPIKDECKTNLNHNFIEYDFDLFNKKLNEKQFQVFSFKNHSHFKVQGFKDFVGYQNLNKVIYAVQGITLPNKSNLQHHYCIGGNPVTADFDGSCQAHIRKKANWENLNDYYEIADNVNDVILHEIEYADHFVDNKTYKNKKGVLDEVFQEKL